MDYQSVATFASLGAVAASLIAAYVSLKVKADQAMASIELLKAIEERFLTRNEFRQYTEMDKRDRDAYREALISQRDEDRSSVRRETDAVWLGLKEIHGILGSVRDVTVRIESLLTEHLKQP